MEEKMKILAFLVLTVIIGCTPPRTILPDIDNDPKIYDVDFQTIKIKYQPPFSRYPKEAKEQKVQGIVVVAITIDQTGKPLSANAIEGPALLRPSAEEYAMAWQFMPTIIDKHPRLVRFNITFPFRLR
jgi:TonB family protein